MRGQGTGHRIVDDQLIYFGRVESNHHWNEISNVTLHYKIASSTVFNIQEETMMMKLKGDSININ